MEQHRDRLERQPLNLEDTIMTKPTQKPGYDFGYTLQQNRKKLKKQIKACSRRSPSLIPDAHRKGLGSQWGS